MMFNLLHTWGHDKKHRQLSCLSKVTKLVAIMLGSKIDLSNSKICELGNSSKQLLQQEAYLSISIPPRGRSLWATPTGVILSPICLLDAKACPCQLAGYCACVETGRGKEFIKYLQSCSKSSWSHLISIILLLIWLNSYITTPQKGGREG